jgi:dihydrolipoamide dehydrogenase
VAEVQLPQLGESVTEGVITRWLVAVGDTVSVDQPIVEISTDKVDTEIPSPVAGTVTELRAAVDDTIEVGATLAVITEGATGSTPAAAPAPDAPAEAATAAPAAPAASAPAPTPAPVAATRGEGRDADVVVLGGGTGGYSTALRAAQLGLRVVLVERAKVGGTCLHWGCIPTKALLQSAEVADSAREAGDFGVRVELHGIDIDAVNAHKDGVVDRMHKGLESTLAGRGVETITGDGRLVGPDTVEVTTADGVRSITAGAVVVATGSVPRELPMAPFDGKRVISSDHALHLTKLPKRAIVLGSGAVGMEFASAWAAFGVEVVLIEALDRLLPLEDADVSKEMARAYRKRGISTMVSARVTAVEASGRGVTATVTTSSGEETVKADLLLVAVGRRPVTEGAGLDAAGVTVDERGFVVVDEYARTNVPGIWAVGDVIDTLGLAHASFAEGLLVADQLAGLDVTPIDYRGVPRVTYSHPEAASMGLTEAQAIEAGHEVVTERYPMQALGRAAIAKASGMVKVIAERDPSQPHEAGRVLGIHLVGPRATDLVAEAQLIYNWEALPTDVAALVHPHPSFSEAIGEAHMALAGRALHG